MRRHHTTGKGDTMDGFNDMAGTVFTCLIPAGFGLATLFNLMGYGIRRCLSLFGNASGPAR